MQTRRPWPIDKMHGAALCAICQRTYHRSGTLWEGRFRTCLTQENRYVLACYRYIELNPVRCNMVAHQTEWRQTQLTAGVTLQHNIWCGGVNGATHANREKTNFMKVACILKEKFFTGECVEFSMKRISLILSRQTRAGEQAHA